jgi:hypothetical protein
VRVFGWDLVWLATGRRGKEAWAVFRVVFQVQEESRGGFEKFRWQIHTVGGVASAGVAE